MQCLAAAAAKILTLYAHDTGGVEEFHVDGFRFDLASALCRDPKGNPIAAPPLIHDLAKDPVLSKVCISSPEAA